MFQPQLSKFFGNATEKPSSIIDTKNAYEFSMQALCIAGEWYAFVQGADLSRMNEIASIIKAEFKKDVQGWLLPDGTGGVMPFAQVTSFQQVTYLENSQPIWLIKLK